MTAKIYICNTSDKFYGCQKLQPTIGKPSSSMATAFVLTSQRKDFVISLKHEKSFICILLCLKVKSMALTNYYCYFTSKTQYFYSILQVRVLALYWIRWSSAKQFMRRSVKEYNWCRLNWLYWYSKNLFFNKANNSGWILKQFI